MQNRGKINRQNFDLKNKFPLKYHSSARYIANSIIKKHSKKTTLIFIHEQQYNSMDQSKDIKIMYFCSWVKHRQSSLIILTVFKLFVFNVPGQSNPTQLNKQDVMQTTNSISYPVVFRSVIEIQNCFLQTIAVIYKRSILDNKKVKLSIESQQKIINLVAKYLFAFQITRMYPFIHTTQICQNSVANNNHYLQKQQKWNKTYYQSRNIIDLYILHQQIKYWDIVSFLQIHMNYKLKYGLLVVIMTALLVLQTQSIARAPIPHCSIFPTIKQIPLAAEELFSYDMSKAFSGYNLNITIGTNNSWADLTRKWHQLDRRPFYYPNLISHYIEPKDNSVGRDSFLLYKDATGTVKLSYGIIRDKGMLPVVNSTAIVTNDKNIVCFDAALFLDHGLAIVDCARTGGTLFTTYTNLFYIIDLTDHSIKKVVENDIYIGFTSITRRKLMKFSHPQAGGFTYLLRSYFSDGVDQAHSDNTYMEVFLVPVQDPTTIQPLRVIDRTFLNIHSLRIMDVQIYLDDIFVLDYDTGLIRLDILQSQRIQIMAYYKEYGFQKFGVYSNDLENQVIIALSNKHSVYEVDWVNPQQPVLINKYSLMENSTVKNVFLNDKYVIVQAAAQAYNDTHPKFEIDYTWIFSKGSRSYTNAYHIIDHNSSQVEIEFDRQNNHLYIADETGSTLRMISQASLVLHYLADKVPPEKEAQLTIFADSYDPHSNMTFRCQQKFQGLFLSRQNMTLFPTGINPTDVYSVNYPKPVQIPLDDYFLGPNMDFQILNHKGDQLPSSWIDKINRTTIRMNPSPKAGDIIFFHTDVQNNLGFESLIYYYQDALYKTHIAECNHLWEAAQMECNDAASFNHSSAILAFTSASFHQKSQWNYYYVIVFEGNNRLVQIVNYGAHKVVAVIQYVGDFQAEVTSVASSNGFLYVLRKYVKTIDVYSFAKCADNGSCSPDFSINSKTMKALGVGYFSPEGIVTDSMHPEVLFIKCMGSLIILDIDNKQKLHLLDEIVSPATLVRNYQVAVSKKSLVIVAYPNLVFEYNLRHLYTYNMVILAKELSTHGMNIQPNADIQFSDYDNTVYVNAVDPDKNISVIIVYRTGRLATNSYYAVIELEKLYSRPGFEVQVSGTLVNFLSVATDTSFRVYRVFTRPFLSIHEAAEDFSFKIQAYNKITNLTTSEVNVTVVNREDILVATKFLNDSLSSNSLKSDKTGNYQWQDRQWFDGNLIHYNYTCDDCHKGQDTKVRIREHVDNFNDLHIGGYAYVQTLTGGISVWDDLFRYRPNGTVYEISNLPDQKRLEDCKKVAAPQNQIFAVTACLERGRGINIYVTSFVSFKAFTWGPYMSGASQAHNLQIVNDIVMIADTPSNPQYRFEQGAIFLYKVSFNPESGDEMDELEVFDSTDFIAAAGWNEDQAYLGNAHLTYSGEADAYRLYVTESRFGFFVIDFIKPHATDSEITVLATSYVNVKKLLADNKMHLPDDACFLSIAHVKSLFNPSLDTENIIITTRGYDNFEITVIFDDSGHVQGQVLHRVYQRYSYYNAVNEVHARHGFVVIGYLNPYSLQQTAHQYIAIYDSIEYPHQFEKGYSERYMMAGIPLNTTYAAGFAINTTYDFHSNGTRSGIVINIAPDSVSTPRLVGASIAHNLTLSLEQGYKSQPIQIKAYNDFSSSNFTVSVEFIPDDGDEKESTIIIIIIVLSCIVFVFIIFYIFSVFKKRQPVEQRESLLTENQTLMRESIPQNLDDYEPPKIGGTFQSMNDESTKPSELVTHQPPQPERMIREVVVEQTVNVNQESVPIKETTLVEEQNKQTNIILTNDVVIPVIEQAEIIQVERGQDEVPNVIEQ